MEFAGGVVEIGHDGPGFAFDNEGPRHKVWLNGYRLADRLVTNAEWLAFMADGGYGRPELWLSEGWATVQGEGWTAPLYWQEDEAVVFWHARDWLWEAKDGLVLYTNRPVARRYASPAPLASP